MMDTYGKVTSKDVNEKIAIASGKKKTKKDFEMEKLKPVECPRCKTLNPRTMDSCSNCWLPFTKKGSEKIKDIEAESTKSLTGDLASNPMFAEKLQKQMEKMVEKVVENKVKALG